MKVASFLKKERMIMNLEAQTKEEAIKEVANLIKDAPEIIDFESFVKDIFDREALATTAIGSQIAIPHARSDNVKNFVIAFGRSREGIDFNALDNKPVKLIFLMGTPKEEGINDYLKILAHLTRLLQKETFRESLLKAKSPEEIIEEFEKVER
ncbi:MAG: PTS sugar transporter subunit IIA [Candidatus Omnitrophica bacterium]|nr:PTS sugar transporter subunit IIA [Candidatus Omnitrophota bacterium]